MQLAQVYTLSNLTWILTGLAIMGSILNGQKRPSGFIWWGLSNIGLMAYNIYYHVWGLVALFVFYTIFDLCMYLRWKRHEDEEDDICE
jgi:uncharacterized membrane protein YuzA (DUF378 family)